MNGRKLLVTLSLLCTTSTTLAHAGHHGGGLIRELWHSLSSPDHLFMLILGFAGIFALLFLAVTYPTRRRRNRRAARSSTR